MNISNLKNKFLSRPVQKQNNNNNTNKAEAPKLSVITEKLPTSPFMKCQLSLNKKGKLAVQVPEGAPVLEPLLSKTIGHPALSYQSLAYSDDRNRHVLLDTKGRLMSLAMTDEGFIGITHSQQKKDWLPPPKPSMLNRNRPTQSHQLELINDFAMVDGKKIALPGKALNEFLTESTSDETGRFRVHMKQLFRFNEASKAWEPYRSQTDRRSLLSTQADGNVYSVNNDRQLVAVNHETLKKESLTEAMSPHLFPDRAQTKKTPGITVDKKIEHFSVSREGHALLQLRNDDDKVQKLVWYEDVNDPNSRLSLNLPHGASCQKTAIFDKTIFAIDYRGALQCAPLPSIHDSTLHFDSGAMNVRAKKINEAISSTIGEGFKLEDIRNVTRDRIYFLVKDKLEQKHFIGVNIDSHNVSIESAWNITDAMTLDHQQGLDPFVPNPKNVIDLDRFGKVTEYDHRPYFLNEKTGQWEMTSEEKSDRMKMTRLRAGLDGAPWILKDDAIKKLKVREFSQRQPESGAVFALPQVKKTLSLDQQIPSLDHDHFITDFAVLDAANVVTVNRYGDLTFRTSGSSKTVNASQLAKTSGKPDLKIQSLGMTAERQLLMLSSKGEVLSLNESQWRAGQTQPLQVITPPRNEFIANIKFIDLHTVKPGVIAFEDGNRDLWIRSGRNWTPYLQDEKEPSTPNSPDVLTNSFETLKADDKVRRMGVVNVKSNYTIGGLHRQRKVKTNFRDRMDAFIFRPTMEWPRPLKNAAYGVQHSFHGREGLKPLYDMQGDLAMQIRILQDRYPDSPSQTMHSRIHALYQHAQTPEQRNLIRELQDFKDILAQSATHYSKLIGKHYGLLDNNLRSTIRPKMKRTKSGLFNIASSRSSNLTEHLKNMMNAYPLDLDNESVQIMTQLFDRNVILNQQKEAVPAGLNRDAYDEIGLVKSRLIHDVLVMRHFHELMDDIEKSFTLEKEKPEWLAETGEKLSALRYGLWDQNPIKAATDQGFENHGTLEGSYDAIRQMVKAFSKENHGVNITTRSVLQASDQAALQQNLLDTLRGMETGESVSFSRGYGVNASVTSYFSRALFVGAGAAARADRGYSMNLTRTEKGFNVSFGRSMAHTANLNMAAVNNLFSQFDPAHPVYLDESHHLPMSKTLLLGGGASLTARNANASTLSLDIAEHELNNFIEQLIAGDLNPIEIMNRGTSPQVTNTNRQDVNLSLNVNASLYVSLPFVSDDVPTTTGIGRFRVAGSANVSAVNYRRERSRSVTSVGESSAQSDNSFSFADRAAINAGLSAPFGPRWFSNGSKENLTAYVSPSADMSVSIDNRTEHKLKIDLNDAPEITSRQIDTIVNRLDRFFTDNASSQLLAQVNRKKENALSPDERLTILDRHFSSWYESSIPSRHHELTGHGQKTALLALQSLVRNQKAYEEKSQLITRAEYQSSFKNANQLEHKTLCQYLASLTNFTHQGVHSDRLKEMMENDHQLKSFIDAIRENPRAIATLTFEFNQDVREQLEHQWAAKTLTQDQISDMLKDRQNLRIKSLNFSHTVKKTDGYASPNFMLGGSNSATVSITEQLGSIQFAYSDNNDQYPASYTIKGRMLTRDNGFNAALDAAKEAGFVLRTPV
ncbi:AvrE-family type 3 secretion system effector [Pantoea sp. Al-1710]|uniref:AvrE-family type 3 secretion system effector n=1 Tax=Candidatus Pantoea communis TaxID=2608354 RepID=A0ABX0RI57_9GAMM|nr:MULTISPECIES: AvrE-family type 3 secretion system effector [Pantoea]NIG12959.1 AvrE-family type 3 secretion system effector [Pantoea sp. Cy-640]NIG17340.1 AvrE-family type 3 secretion system effector [Pantoea communis]